LAGGSSTGHSGSSSRQSLKFEGWAKKGLSLGPPSNPSQLPGGSESNMETDNDGDDDKEKNTEEEKDSEPRFDLPDDLLHKVRLEGQKLNLTVLLRSRKFAFWVSEWLFDWYTYCRYLEICLGTHIS